jgi:hypothetical protein
MGNNSALNKGKTLESLGLLPKVVCESTINIRFCLACYNQKKGGGRREKTRKREERECTVSKKGGRSRGWVSRGRGRWEWGIKKFWGEVGGGERKGGKGKGIKENFVNS